MIKKHADIRRNRDNANLKRPKDDDDEDDVARPREREPRDPVHRRDRARKSSRPCPSEKNGRSRSACTIVALETNSSGT